MLDAPASVTEMVPVVAVTVKFVAIDALNTVPVEVQIRVPVPMVRVRTLLFDASNVVNCALKLLRLYSPLLRVPVEELTNASWFVTDPPKAAIVNGFVNVCPADVNVNTPRPSIVNEVVPLFVIPAIIVSDP